VSIAAADALVTEFGAKLGGPLVLPFAAAPVQNLDDTDIFKNFALVHVVNQPDAETAGVGWNGQGAMMGGCPHQFPGVHPNIAEIYLTGQAFGYAIDQEVPVPGIQLRTSLKSISRARLLVTP
jgi:hypothetical protein